jgi:leader peptidase (prepilin peptidase) / N-methyltransferase
VTVASLLVGLALAALMLAIAVSDWRRFRVPNALTAAALGLRAVDILTGDSGPVGPAFGEAFVRGFVMAGLFYVFRSLYRRLRGREGLGLGDVKLAGVAGAWVDWPMLPLVVEVAAVIGLGVALFRAVSSGAGLRADTRLPFAVGFAPAIFMGWQVGRLNF